MFDYASLAVDAAAMIEEFGAPMTLSRAKAGDYDPTTGDVDDNGTQLYSAKAVRSRFRKFDIDGTQIRASDVRLLVSPTLPTTPQTGDSVTFDGVTYTVVNVSMQKPASVVLLYDLQLRNG